MTKTKTAEAALDQQLNGEAVYQRALAIDINHIITGDDEPVDNLPTEKQQRCLAEPPYCSWDGEPQWRKFGVAANVPAALAQAAAAQRQAVAAEQRAEQEVAARRLAEEELARLQRPPRRGSGAAS